jgi:phosphoribosylformylglycinamidine cyclo-ligase
LPDAREYATLPPRRKDLLRARRVPLVASDAQRPVDYSTAGVSASDAESGLARLAAHVRTTWPTATTGDGAVKLDLGYFASVVDIGGLGIAICADGIGTKALIAQMMDRYDTVGIDCVAMNVNDLVCVGATPITLVDYIAVERAEPDMLADLGEGLAEGAKQAGISISGGEIAQMRDVIKGAVPGKGFDLAGTAIGRVDLSEINVGADVQPGDAILGIASNGIHSNGLSLARKVFFETANLSIDDRIEGLDETVGEALLRPTHIYVREALDLLSSDVPVHALAHITGDGFLNLTRVEARVGMRLDTLPPPPPIFGALQRLGAIDDREMFQVFNMGIGFCAIVPAEHETRAGDLLAMQGKPCQRIGTVVDDPARRVRIESAGLVGKSGGGFVSG